MKPMMPQYCMWCKYWIVTKCLNISIFFCMRFRWSSYYFFSVFSFSFFFSCIQGGHFSGIYRKVQLKPLKWVKITKSNGEEEEERPVEALMVLKYGGVLTHAGRKQVMIIYASCTCFCILISISIYKEYSNKIVAENYTLCKIVVCNILFIPFVQSLSIDFASLISLQAEDLGRYFRNNMYPGYSHGSFSF